MRGRQSPAYRVREGDRQSLPTILAEGQLLPRVAKRARALFALDEGERLGAVGHWLGWSRMGRW
jgi:hypothetical protein